MTEDLEAIDVLSLRFKNRIEQLRTHDSGEIVSVEPLTPQGMKIMRMYEAEGKKSPNDTDVRASLAQHLYRMGWMHYRAILFRYLPNRDKDAGTLGDSAVTQANHCCHYMFYSFQTMPNAQAALILATVFKAADFRRTAYYWLEQAEQSAVAANELQTALEAKADRLDMQADGNIADPPLTNKVRFPTVNTMGILKPG